MKKKVKVLAYYLPQYYPFPENNLWWGTGFTEWTNVGKAKPLYKGHYQPYCPTDLGYYDLRVPETRDLQAEMAQKYGVHGFIYYHYWFGNGKRLLDKIEQDVLNAGKPDFPFCFCWANETWSGIWHGLNDKILAKQEYPGLQDVRDHFNYLLPYFSDSRYIKIDNAPLLMILDAEKIPPIYIQELKACAIAAGFSGLYMVASNKNPDSYNYKEKGFDAKVSNAVDKAWHYLWFGRIGFIERLRRRLNRVFPTFVTYGPHKASAKDLYEKIEYINTCVDTIPMVLPNWDNTPRAGRRGNVLENATPEVFGAQINKALKFLNDNPNKDNIMVVKSWNEWAEGNVLEPERRFGLGFLETLRDKLK